MAIAATGGVIGVTPIRGFLDTDGDGVTGMDDVDSPGGHFLRVFRRIIRPR